MSDEYKRVQRMILDDGTNWDLTKTDKDALRHVLGLVNSLASELADYTGYPVATMVERHNGFVKNGFVRRGQE
jgi:DNA-binding MarR family transcriptional regulator